MLQPHRFTCSRALFVVLFLVVATSACLGTGSSVNAYGGERFLDSNDWDGIDNPTVYGADVVLKLDMPMLAVEGGWFHSEDDASSAGGLTDPELSLDEYFVGLRVTPWHFLIEPYGSVGVSHFEGDLNGSGAPTGTDSSLGYYARLGAAIRFGFLRFGLDGRASFSDSLDLDAIQSDVDGYQLAAFLGIAF